MNNLLKCFALFLVLGLAITGRFSRDEIKP